MWSSTPINPAASRASRTPKKILREINGYHTGDPERHLAGSGDLKDDGSTTCARGFIAACIPRRTGTSPPGRSRDPPDCPGPSLTVGWAWPANPARAL